MVLSKAAAPASVTQAGALSRPAVRTPSSHLSYTLEYLRQNAHTYTLSVNLTRTVIASLHCCIWKVVDDRPTAPGALLLTYSGRCSHSCRSSCCCPDATPATPPSSSRWTADTATERYCCADPTPTHTPPHLQQSTASQPPAGCCRRRRQCCCLYPCLLPAQQPAEAPPLQ